MVKSAMLPFRLVLPLLCGYFLITILGLAHHELALEEAQFFLFGRDSESLSALYHNMQYEGHPRLWCFLLYGIIHYITPGYIGLQALQLFISTTTIFLLLRYAPFSLVSKILIMAGYFFIFEYGLLSRSYSLGLLFLFACCPLLRSPGRNMLRIGGLLVLLCNTHLFFSFAAIGVFFYVLLDRAENRKLVNGPFFLFSCLVLAGIISTLIQGRIPQEDKLIPIIPGGWHTARNFAAANYAIIRGWLPIPNISDDHFWNSYWLDDNNIGVGLRSLLFLGFLFFPALILRKYIKALVFYYTVLSLLFVFFLILPMVASRYFGVGFVAFLAACWMAGNEQEMDIIRSEAATTGNQVDFFNFRHLASRPWRRFAISAFYVVLLTQAAIGIYAYGQDFRRPFSQARNAVSFVKERRLADQEIVVDGYISGPALSVYLGRPLYYLTTGAMGSYCIWKKSNLPSPQPSLERELSTAAFVQGLDQFILISSRPLDAGLVQSGDSHFNFTLLGGFPNSITIMENSYIYQAQRKIHDPKS